MTIKRLVSAFVAVVVALSLCAAAYAAEPNAAHVRGVVLFLGDSNLMLGAGQVEFATTYGDHWDDGYVPVIASRVEAGLRTQDCPGRPYVGTYNCPTYNYWSTRVPEILARVKPNAVVVNLGINDTFAPGTRTTQGYARYGAKIDEFMHLLPKSIPVLWTNLPCKVEPAPMRPGCAVVNAALAKAPRRWRHLTMVNWGALANAHPEWLLTGDVHYNPYGDTAWANTVVAALDTKLKPRS